MRLQEYEDQIRDMWKNDRNNPELWELLKLFCYEFFRRKHLMNTEEANHEASEILAEEFYTKLMKGEEIYHLLGYTGLCYHSAIRTYRKMNVHEVIDVVSNPQLEEAIVSMSASNINEGIYRKALDLDFINYLPKFIEQILENSYYEVDSANYLNAKLSIYLSFIKGTFVKYNISNEELDYVKMLYQNVQNRIKKELTYNCEIDYLSNLSPLQIYTLDTYVDGDNYD